MGLAAGLHEVMARLVYEKGQVSPREVDVRFDAPRREWVGALTKPTLDFYLFDVRENVDLRYSDLQANRTPGVPSFRLPPRRFDLRYMVSALTTNVEDEHILLWRALAVLLRYTTIPQDILPDEYRAIEPPLAAQVTRPDEDNPFLDLWGSLETHPRPSLMYVVTAPIDLDVTIEAPLVFTRTMHYMNASMPGSRRDTTIHIGGTVRDREGRPVSNASVRVEGRASAPSRTDGNGRFVLVGVPEGKLPVRVSRNGGEGEVATLIVPSEAYDLVVP